MILMNEPLDIRRGDTYEHTLYMMDNDGTALNLSGYAVASNIVNAKGDIRILLDITPYIDIELLADSGILVLSIPPDITNSLIFNKGIWDCKMIEISTGRISTIAEGVVLVHDTVTNAQG
jgi:hypothetical protein